MTDKAISPLRRRMMLRRSHDHHRGVRARCNATASADSSNQPHQARHLITMSQSRKSAPHSRCLSTSHGRAHSDIRQTSQIARQLAQVDATYRSFIGCFTVAQLVGPTRSHSISSPAAPKSP